MFLQQQGNIQLLKQAVKIDDIPAKNAENEVEGTEESEALDFVNEMKNAAQQAQNTTGFVYEPTSGLYYDSRTGYYYNAVFVLL